MHGTNDITAGEVRHGKCPQRHFLDRRRRRGFPSASGGRTGLARGWRGLRVELCQFGWSGAPLLGEVGYRDHQNPEGEQYSESEWCSDQQASVHMADGFWQVGLWQQGARAALVSRGAGAAFGAKLDAHPDFSAL